MRSMIQRSLSPYDLMTSMMNGPCNGKCADFLPDTDILETEGGFRLVTDLPGLDKDDISVEVKDGVLSISGERKTQALSEKDTCLRSERVTGPFNRTFRLGRGVDAEQISAAFKNGVLTLELKKSQAVLPRRIPVQND